MFVSESLLEKGGWGGFVDDVLFDFIDVAWSDLFWLGQQLRRS